MLIDVLLIGIALVLLYFGADLLVKGAAGLAVKLGVPVIVVGLTVVAYGTSAPELVVSLQGALGGRGGIAAGNVIGSNIFNICVILGLAALMRPVRATLRVLRIDVPLMVGVSLAGLAVLWDGAVSRLEGLLLVLGAIAYTAANYITGLKASPQEALVAGAELPRPRALWIMLLEIAGGLLLLVLGSDLLVRGAVGIATDWGVSEAVIGLTIVAAGTSMPELATSVVAARKGESDIALGNIVGSNLFNILLILGAAGSIAPFEALGLTKFDLWFMIGSALLMWPLVWTGHRLGRREGALLLGGYGIYLWFMWPA